jgi:outer membrane protein assembly factor BamD
MRRIRFSVPTAVNKVPVPKFIVHFAFVATLFLVAIAPAHAVVPSQAADVPAPQATTTVASPQATAPAPTPAPTPAPAQSRSKRQKQPKERKARATPVTATTTTTKQPDKELYEKALASLKKGHFDVARLQLQALLNTYPESEYQMRAKLAIGDTWYKEGGSAALTQAENEYKDFITFFPTAPEAAEAQMRVADIYFRQIEKPDRDYQKTVRAEQEYRLMIQQFPDSPLVPRAKQRLREVQEVLAQRQFDIAAFYATHMNWAATIARFQTVVDTYPLYSKADQALLGLGDAYMAESRQISMLKGPENLKSQLVAVYQEHAAAAYDHIIQRYPLESDAAIARQRLASMHKPIPVPSKEALAENEAEIESRAPVTLTSRALLLVNRQPEVLEADRVGEPDMDPPKPTLAPEITKENVAIYNSIIHPPAAAGSGDAPATAAGGPPNSSDAGANTATSSGSGDSTSLTVVAPSADATAPATTSDSPAADSAAAPPSNGAVPATATTKLPGGLASVGPKDTTLPAVEHPAEAPDQVNEVHNNGGAPATKPATTGKKKAKRPKEDKGDESSSKDKKKKGLNKLNPF